MDSSFSLGFRTSIILIVLELAYIVALSMGLAFLPTPESPIQDPWFTAMELLILSIAPALVVLMTALYTTADPQKKPFALVSVFFMLAVCIITTCLHFSILVLSRHEAFQGAPWGEVIFPFKWPSVASALDIVAWDVFWPLSMFFAALAMGTARLEKGIKALMLLSAFLSAVGLLGVVTGNMSHRNIGIVGYVPVFMAILILLSFYFRKPARANA